MQYGIQKFNAALADFTLDFRFNGNEKQKEVFKILMDLENGITEVGYGGAAGGAKTFSGVAWAWLMRTSYPNTRSFFWRKRLKDVKNSTYASYKKFCRIYKIPEELRGHYNKQDNIITFPNGSEIIFLELMRKPSDPDQEEIGGYEFTDGLIEESAEVDQDVIDTLYSRVGRQENSTYGLPARIMETFNPNTGHVKRRFWTPWKEGKLPKNRVFIRSLATDNKYNTPEYLAVLQGYQFTNPIKYQRLWLGNFDYDDSPGRLFTYEDIQGLLSNPDYIGDRRIVCDPAGQGDDTAVITVWDRLKLLDKVEYLKSDMVTLQNEIIRLARIYQVPMKKVLVDIDGIGVGIRDNLKCIGFQNGGSVIDNRTDLEKKSGIVPKPNFSNLKNQCYFKLSDMVGDSMLNLEIIQNDKKLWDRIEGELDAIVEIDIDKDESPRRIIKKEDLKKKLGRSPDWADTLAMLMFFELGGVQKKVAVVRRH